MGNNQENHVMPQSTRFFGPDLGGQSAEGDFLDLSFSERQAIHDSWAKKFYQGMREEGIPNHVSTEAQRLRSEIDTFREAIQAPAYQTLLDTTAARFITADLLTHKRSKQEQAAARFELFEGIKVVSDMDGTMTSNTHEYIPHGIPGSYVAEDHMEQHGRETFSDMFAGVWKPSLEHDPHTYQEGAQLVAIREGVNEFLKYAKENDIDFSVLTANFDAFVKGVLAKIPHARGVDYYAITPDSILSTAKGEILDFIAVHNPNEALVFIGDGSSDLEALKAKGVAMYFALEEGSFAKELEKEGKLYFPYRTFTDIQVQLEEIQGLMKTRTKAA